MFSALTFGAPWWLWGLLALPALAALFVWAEIEAGRRLARLIRTPRLRGQLAGAASPGRRRTRFSLLLAGLGALILAAAAPRVGYETRDVHRRGLDVIVIADVSKSMLAKDLPPSRLVRAKLAVQDLTMQLQGDRLGLVAFAGNAFLQAPLTLDYDAVLAAAELDTDLIPRGGTNLGGAIDLALEAFGKAEGGNRAIILFSDGEPTDDSEQGKGLAAAARAAEAGVRIYTVGFGTPEGALIPLGDQGSFVRDQDGKTVHSALNEGGLTALAKAANGFYVRFTGDGSIKTVVEQGLSQLKASEIDTRQARRPIERYQWPLGAAMLLLTLAALLSERRRTRDMPPPIPRQPRAPAAVAMGLLVLLAFLPQGRAEDAQSAPPSGNALDLYRAGQYGEAYRAFEDLAKRNPQIDSLQFNAGASAYMGKQYDDALEAFNKTLTSPDPNLQAKANYNFANTLFRRGEGQEDRDKKIKDWRNAVEHYKSTLDTLKRSGVNAADTSSKAFATDTAYNRDLVQKRLDDLLKEPPKPPSGDPKKKDDKPDLKQNGDPSDQNQPPKPDQSPSPDQKQQGQGQSPPDGTPPPDKSGQSSDQKDQPPKSGASPSPQSGNSGSSDRKKDPSNGGQSPSQSPNPGSGPDQDKPRQRGDFQSRPGSSPAPTPGGAQPTPDGAQPTPGEAPDEAGKMSPAQARALLESLKNQDQRVNLSDPSKTRHSEDERVLKDW